MTYVEKLARLLYYALIALLVAAALYVLVPLAITAFLSLRATPAWDNIVAYGAVALMLGFACVITWAIFDLPRDPAKSERRKDRNRRAVGGGVALIAVLLTIAGYTDSGWSGVGEVWGLAAMVVFFWAVVGGAALLIAKGIKRGARVVSRSVGSERD